MTARPQTRQERLIMHLTQLAQGELTQGKFLRTMRKQVFQMSQSEYAAIAGVSRRTISALENDDATPNNVTLDKIFAPMGLRTGLMPIRPEVLVAMVNPLTADHSILIAPK